LTVAEVGVEVLVVARVLTDRQLGDERAVLKDDHLPSQRVEAVLVDRAHERHLDAVQPDVSLGEFEPSDCFLARPAEILVLREYVTPPRITSPGRT
jgi:hypothetical protein